MSLCIVTQADIGSRATPTPARLHGPASRTLNLPDEPRNAVFHHHRSHVHRPSCITNHLILLSTPVSATQGSCANHYHLPTVFSSEFGPLLVIFQAPDLSLSTTLERTTSTHLQFCLRVPLKVACPFHLRSTAADGELVKYRILINSLCAAYFRGLRSALGLNLSGRTRQYMGTSAEHCISDYSSRDPESTLLKSTKVNQT